MCVCIRLCVYTALCGHYGSDFSLRLGWGLVHTSCAYQHPSLAVFQLPDSISIWGLVPPPCREVGEAADNHPLYHRALPWQVLGSALKIAWKEILEPFSASKKKTGHWGAWLPLNSQPGRRVYRKPQLPESFLHASWKEPFSTVSKSCTRV